MDYIEACESTISIKAAIRELVKHGFNGFVDNGFLVATDDYVKPEQVAKLDQNGNVHGLDILNWLGY